MHTDTASAISTLADELHVALNTEVFNPDVSMNVYAEELRHSHSQLRETFWTHVERDFEMDFWLLEPLDGRSLHVRSLHARCLCVNLSGESRVLAKKAVDSLECVERRGGGNAIVVTQRQDH